MQTAIEDIAPPEATQELPLLVIAGDAPADMTEIYALAANRMRVLHLSNTRLSTEGSLRDKMPSLQPLLPTVELALDELAPASVGAA